jgi:hypothetical protein
MDNDGVAFSLAIGIDAAEHDGSLLVSHDAYVPHWSPSTGSAMIHNFADRSKHRSLLIPTPRMDTLSD